MALLSRGYGTGVSLAGTPARAYSGTFGGIPTIPDPGASASEAIGGNLANLGSLYNLGQGYNQFQTGQAIGQIAQGLPNYSSMVGQSSKNIGAELRGDVPSDVIEGLIRGAAERGYITGLPGDAPNSQAAYLRLLGLTSLQQMQTGEQNLTGAIARTPRPPLFDPQSMFVNPAQQQEAAVTASYANAAPIPAMAGTATLGAAQSGLRAGMGSITPSHETVRPRQLQGWNLALRDRISCRTLRR
jgi:hypothetical protein